MMWDELRERISGLPEFGELARRLGGSPTAVKAYGLSGSSRSLLLASLIPRTDRRAVVIATDPLAARDIVSDLEFFGTEGVVFYPEDEILPYDYHDPDRYLTGMQMSALDGLSAGRCRVLVCTVRSLLKKVFEPELFRGLLIDLKQGQEHDPFDLAEKLVDLGYERHGTVEAKGQFAIRGGIVDLFEVSAPCPVRMEFDGDEIVSMRDFDIETQRSSEERKGLRIHPLHHLVPDEEGIRKLERFLEDGAGSSEQAKLPAERLNQRIHFFGMEHYAAVVHDVVPILDYFETPPMVVVYDGEETKLVLEEFRKEIEDRYDRSGTENIYPHPDMVYMSGDEWEARIGETRRLDFMRVKSEGAVGFSTTAVDDYRRNIKGLAADVKKELGKGRRVILFCGSEVQRSRAEEILDEVSLEIDFPIGGISRGFKWPDAGIVFLSEEEVFGRFHKPWHAPARRSRSLAYDPSHFQPGDFVVHVDHGIGRYMGMRVLEVEGSSTECLDIRYEGDDRLFIPVSRLRLVEKYLGAEEADPEIARLGSAAWDRIRKKARKSAEKIARDLLEVYAARQVAEGFAYGRDGVWQNEMEASFPWEETPHQVQATGEVKADMEAEKPMDRLLCGDVGFGKTEVAVRAAFKAALAGKQVALLVPTTVLALQHFNTLRERLGGFPLNIEMLSRFVPARERKMTVERIARGEVDIAVGTHRLLSKDVRFNDLGLVIIDEEHRFGVAHKERLGMMKKSIDILSMTATPIPRTLSMAVSGIRDISVIDTPPRNRLPIHTEILQFDDERIHDAIIREIDRGGQVFFVHNRVQSIRVMEGYIRRLLPERVRIAHAHGQMKEKDLEKIMIDFLERKHDVLVCTMIIEAGLDFPNVNTIIINRADRFGLAQLYQLRGRVGRSDRKAYAYMLVPKGRILTATAIRRLQAITEFDHLGAGYRIAMRDLEIRGAGNILGHQQSGQVNAVGLDMYTRMLREEVARIRGEAPEEEEEVRISMPVPAYLPEEYIMDTEERVDIYRRLSRAVGPDDVEAIRDELTDRFGPLPDQGRNMIRLASIKARARGAGIDSVEECGGILNVGFAAGRTPAKKVLVRIADQYEGRLTFQTGAGFSLSIKVAEDRSGGVDDIESLLKLLEFYGR
jgi:transcription-repair coupling factor (superfamily II helicase)